MDLQYIVDTYGCVYYVVNYVNKSQRGMSLLLRNIMNEIRDDRDTPLKRAMMKMGSAFLGKQEIPAQEAVYICLGMQQCCTSTGKIFVNTSSPEKRTRLLKSKAQLLEICNEDATSTNVFYKNILDYYELRPMTDDFNHICLAVFTTSHDIKYTKSNDDEQNDAVGEETTTHEAEIILLDGKSKIAKRNKTKILRYPKFKEDVDPLAFYGENVLLFHPWRNEELQINNQNVEHLYTLHKENILRNSKLFNKIEERELEYAEQEIDAITNNVDGDETIEKEGWIKGDSVIDHEKGTDHAGQIPDLEPDAQAVIEIQRLRNPALISDDEYQNLIATLNVSQRQYLYHYTSTLRNQITNKTSEPMLHFISGPAGTGKSLLIKVLTQATIKIVSNQVDDPDLSLPKILLTAPTGKAAFAIKGITLHNAFRLPLAQFSGILQSLNPNIANTLRSQYYSVKTLVIDEISMVSRQTFRRIDMRLKQMFTDAPFGGLNVILFQLPAIGVPLYAPLNSVEDNDEGMSHLTGRFLWDLFKFFELTEIMRQKDDKIFAERLTRLGRGQMTMEDERFFESLEVDGAKRSNVDSGNKPIHLFGTNKEVDNFNRVSLSQIDGEEIVSEAFDSGCEKDVKAAAKLARNNTLGIAKSVVLKRNGRYMLITNVDTEDGICKWC